MSFKSKAQASNLYKMNPRIAKEFQKKTLSIKNLPDRKSKPMNK